MGDLFLSELILAPNDEGWPPEELLLLVVNLILSRSADCVSWCSSDLHLLRRDRKFFSCEGGGRTKKRKPLGDTGVEKGTTGALISRKGQNRWAVSTLHTPRSICIKIHMQIKTPKRC